MTTKVFSLAAELALAVGGNDPAQAQYMSSPYPVIVVPPPPAQNLVAPKSPPKQAEPPKTSAPPPNSSPPDLGRCYQGRTRVC